MDARQLRKGRFHLWQFGFLLIVGGADALSALPPGFTLLQGVIVEHTTLPDHLLHCLCLFRRGVQPIFIGFAARRFIAHRLLFSHIGKRTASISLVLRSQWTVFRRPVDDQAFIRYLPMSKVQGASASFMLNSSAQKHTGPILLALAISAHHSSCIAAEGEVSSASLSRARGRG